MCGRFVESVDDVENVRGRPDDRLSGRREHQRRCDPAELEHRRPESVVTIAVMSVRRHHHYRRPFGQAVGDVRHPGLEQREVR